MTISSPEIARILLEIDCVGFAPQEPITFKSGILSPVYVDNRRLPAHPAEWRQVIAAFDAVRSQLMPQFVAGVATGGIPHSSALGYMSQTPAVFVRKEAKEYGKGRRIEGGDVTNQAVLLVEDLITTGSSSLSAVEALRDAGAQVDHVVAIVSYGFEEAMARFVEHGITLHTLTQFADIARVARETNRLSDHQLEIITQWMNNPRKWRP